MTDKPTLKDKKIYPQSNVLVCNFFRDGEYLAEKNISKPRYSIASSWTYQGAKGVTRSLFLFPTDEIPARIVSARLCLFGLGHDPLTASNACHILRVVSDWNGKRVSWNTQPKTSPLFKKSLSRSSHSHQDYFVDLTGWVRRWRHKLIGFRARNFGIILKLQEEDCYAKMQFGALKNSNPDKRPYLLVTYYA